MTWCRTKLGILLAWFPLACGGAPAQERAADASAHAKASSPAPRHATLEEAVADLEASRYRRAERKLRALIEAGRQRDQAHLWLARLQLRTGHADEAAHNASMAAAANARLAEPARLVEAEAHWRRGGHAKAADLLTPWATRRGSYEAQRLLGEVLLERGQRQAAEPILLRLIDAYNDGHISKDDGVALALVGRAASLLGSPEDANEAYAEAEHVIPDDLRLLLWRAELFLEAHDPGQAERVIGRALRLAPSHAEALALLAHIKLDQALDFAAARELAARALAADPTLPRAYFVLAGMGLRDGDTDSAEESVSRGLRHHPDHLRLLSMRGAARFVAEDASGFAAVRERVLALNPEYSEFFRIVGTYADWEHRYGELVDLMRAALAVDENDAKAEALLGFNLIRAGREEEGMRALRAAYETTGAFDVRVVNTLNLYENVIAREYETVVTPRFRFRFHRDERALLERYVPALLDRAWDVLRIEHGFQPRVPVGIELYSERRSFAVRTSGMPHTAIQGVCFGETLAAMTPRQEPFNFGMTLWHELAHVFHIQLSRSRVPRWFTEGLAEHQTSRVRPEWKRELDRELYLALRADRLPTVGRMNQSFTHAERVEDVALAYYASGRLVAHLEEAHGRKALVELMKQWGEGRTTEVVLAGTLGRDPSAIDKQFRSYLEAELGRYLSQFVPPWQRRSLKDAQSAVRRHPQEVDAHASLALAWLGVGDLERAAMSLARAREVAGAEPRAELAWLDAELALAQGNMKLVEGALDRLIAAGSDGYPVRMLEARLARAAGAGQRERRALALAAAFDPSQSAPVLRLAVLAQEAEQRSEEIRWLEKLALLEEHDPGVYRRLLSLLVAEERFDEAVQWGEAALWADIRGFHTHALWAEALAAVGQTGQALFELESALLCEAPPEMLAAAHRSAARLAASMGRARDGARHRAEADALERTLEAGHRRGASDE